MVADATGESGQRAMVKDRHDEDDVVQMLAVLIGVVGDKGIGRPELRQIMLRLDEGHRGGE